MFDRLPDNPEVAVASKPVRVNPTAFLLLAYLRSHGDQIERGQGQDKAKARKGFCVTDQAGLQLEAVGFVVQEVLLNLEPQAILVKAFHTGDLVADDQPLLFGAFEAGQSQMDWAKVFNL
jgi:hypothetical protein